MWVKTFDGSLVNLETARVVLVIDDKPASVTVSHGFDDVSDIYRGDEAECEQVLRGLEQAMKNSGKGKGHDIFDVNEFRGVETA